MGEQGRPRRNGGNQAAPKQTGRQRQKGCTRAHHDWHGRCWKNSPSLTVKCSRLEGESKAATIPFCVALYMEGGPSPFPALSLLYPLFNASNERGMVAHLTGVGRVTSVGNASSLNLQALRSDPESENHEEGRCDALRSALRLCMHCGPGNQWIVLCCLVPKPR